MPDFFILFISSFVLILLAFGGMAVGLAHGRDGFLRPCHGSNIGEPAEQQHRACDTCRRTSETADCRRYDDSGG